MQIFKTQKIILTIFNQAKRIKNGNKKKEEEEAKRQVAEKKIKEKADDDARIAAHNAAEEARKQKEATLKLLTIKHYEFLKDTNGDKAACIDYFKEHYPDRTFDNVLEFKAYKKAVEMYEHPILVMEEGE